MAENSSKFGKRHTRTHTHTHPKIHHCQTSENQSFPLPLENNKRKEIPYLYRNNNSNDSGFLNRNLGSQEWHIFQVLKEKNCQPRVYNQQKYRNEGATKTFSDERKLRICYQQTSPTRRAEGSSLTRKGTLREGTTEHQEERTLQEKSWVNMIGFPSSAPSKELGWS